MKLAIERALIAETAASALGRRDIKFAGAVEGTINTILRLESGGRLYALRLRTREDVYRYAPGVVKEAVLAGVLEGRFPVPRLVCYDASRRTLPHPYSLYEWVEGKALWDEPRPALYEQAGRLLRRLHATPVGPELGRRLGRLRTPGPRPRRLALAHNDFSGANIIVKGGAVRGVIDWDNAVVDAPELDLVKMKYWTARGADGVLTHAPALYRAFLKGYGTAPDAARLRRLERWWLERVRDFELSKERLGLRLSPGYPPTERYEAWLGEVFA